MVGSQTLSPIFKLRTFLMAPPRILCEAHRDGLVLESLDDEVGDDSAVVHVHPGAVGVENSGDTNVDT